MMIKKLFKILIQCTIANRLIFYDTLYNNTKDNQKIKGIFYGTVTTYAVYKGRSLCTLKLNNRFF